MIIYIIYLNLKQMSTDFFIITEEIINAGTILFCVILLLITSVLNFYEKLELKSYSLASLTFIYTH